MHFIIEGDMYYEMIQANNLVDIMNIDKVLQYIKNKRKPTIYFGKIITLEGLIEEDEIVDQLWDTYQKLTPFSIRIPPHPE